MSVKRRRLHTLHSVRLRRCHPYTRGVTPSSLLPQDVLEALGRGTTVIASNARAARALRRGYATHMQRTGSQSWAAPTIHDWAGWLKCLYRELAARLPEALPVLLTDLQEQHLWRTVQASEAKQVVSPAQLAVLAAQAYGLLHQYSAQAERRSTWAETHEDAGLFLRWATEFDALCERLRVLPPSAMAPTLRQHLPHLRLPEELFIVGFDRLEPAQQELLDAMQAQGCHVMRAHPGEPTQRFELLCADDETQELYACANWARTQLEQAPTRKLAILLPQVAGARARLDRALRRVLTPHAAMSPAGGALPYEFSLGIPLGQVPLVYAALQVLRWTTAPLASSAVSALLTGGFFASDAVESLALAEADAVLRRRGQLHAQAELKSLLFLGSRTLPQGWLARMGALQTWAAAERNRRRTHAEWAALAEQQLEAAGWPGHREISSTAYQARQRFASLIVDTAGLSFTGERVRWSTFVSDLRGFAQQTLFAAESLDAPVQVLGIAEASGQIFDAIWVLQATESRWPTTGRPHPLLSTSMQAAHGMPHASSLLDLQLGQLQVARVLASAPVITASYARMGENGELRRSPLLAEWGESHKVTSSNPLAAVPCAMQTVQEPDTVVPWPAEQPAGGSEIIKRQSACGMQSFAVRRLGASALEDERWGPDARERGDLLHTALEQLWSREPVAADSDRLHTSHDLARAIEDGTAEAKVQAAIARALEKTMKAADGDPWTQHYLLLEHERLATRLNWWLLVEAERGEFAVVDLEKKVQEAPVGPLRLNLRVDRVDRLADGSRFILDYKTGGDVSAQQWMNERPEEPQLPIYALYGGLDNVSGIAFGQIRAASTKLHSLERAQEDKKQRVILDERQLAEWDRILLGLAGQFAEGAAPVNPRSALTCDRCGLYGVCRVRSQADIALPEDEEEQMQHE